MTTAQNKCTFARLCVELDLSKALEAFVQINQIRYNIEYEGLPEICYLCGWYDNCDMQVHNANGRQLPIEKDGDKLNPGIIMDKHENMLTSEGLRGPSMIV